MRHRTTKTPAAPIFLVRVNCLSLLRLILVNGGAGGPRTLSVAHLYPDASPKEVERAVPARSEQICALT